MIVFKKNKKQIEILKQKIFICEHIIYYNSTIILENCLFDIEKKIKSIDNQKKVMNEKNLKIYLKETNYKYLTFQYKQLKQLLQ